MGVCSGVDQLKSANDLENEACVSMLSAEVTPQKPGDLHSAGISRWRLVRRGREIRRFCRFWRFCRIDRRWLGMHLRL